MQERVTLKKQNSLKKVTCITLVVVMIVTIFCIATILVLKRKSPKCFDEMTYYFVYTQKANKQSLLSSQVDSLKGNGGAAVIHFYKEDYYLLVSVYKTKAEAEEVQNNIKNIYPESGVLALKTKKTNKKVKKVIKGDELGLKSIEKFYYLCDTLMIASMSYLSGNLSQNQFLVDLLKIKLEIEDNLKKYNPETESGKQIYNHLLLCKLQLDDFFNKFFESTKKESKICEITVNLNLLRLELSNNL